MTHRPTPAEKLGKLIGIDPAMVARHVKPEDITEKFNDLSACDNKTACLSLLFCALAALLSFDFSPQNAKFLAAVAGMTVAMYVGNHEQKHFVRSDIWRQDHEASRQSFNAGGPDL